MHCGYDARVNAFRVLALAYAMAALLIAPSWLTAQDTPVADGDAPAAEEPAAVAPAQPPATEPAPESAPAPTEEEAPVVVAQEADEPASGEKPVAKAAQDDGKSKDDQEPVAKAAASASVTITDFEFTPATVTVNEGDTVTWTNEGPTPHTATAEDGSFDTGNLNKGESGSATFDTAGTISYICTPHPYMKGKVVVQAASAGSDDSDDVTAGSTESDPTATTADDDDDGLPATGGETLLIALLGLATLGAGLLLRKRDQASD